MRYLTAGESHGMQLTVIIEGVPANLYLTEEMINLQMTRRMQGYGRGGRMKIEKDRVKVTAGIRHGYTFGAPICIEIENRDFKHWSKIMGSAPIDKLTQEKMKRIITQPRPGHADLVGGMKYQQQDLRNILERSSARETAARVAAGAVAQALLTNLGIEIVSRVVNIGGVSDEGHYDFEIIRGQKMNDVMCMDATIAQQMRDKIDAARKAGDSLGGIVEVQVKGLPIGLGSYAQYDRKLDGRLAAAVLSINAFKGVEFGEGFNMANLPGSQVHDEIIWSKHQGFTRATNRLGGIEGGMSNGMPLIIKGVMKPIPTLYQPLASVDIRTKEVFKATVERSDACAVPAASVVMEHVIAFELAKIICEQFHADTLQQLIGNITTYQRDNFNY